MTKRMPCSSTATHTPGPWQQHDDVPPYGKDYAATVWGSAGPGYGLIADCRGCGAGTPNERIANARLIAAAPELLAALLGARAELEEYERLVSGESYNNLVINRALAKATGD